MPVIQARPADLGHDRRASRRPGLLDEPPDEAAADHRLVDEVGRQAAVAAGMELAIRAEVPVPHGERSSHPGWIAVALRASAPFRAGGVEDHVLTARGSPGPADGPAACARTDRIDDPETGGRSAVGAFRSRIEADASRRGRARRSCRRTPCRSERFQALRRRRRRRARQRTPARFGGSRAPRVRRGPGRSPRRAPPVCRAGSRSRARSRATIPHSTSTVATPIVPWPHIGRQPETSMNSTPQSASARVGGCRNAPDIAAWPRGSRISIRRRSSRCSSKYSRRSCIDRPGQLTEAAGDHPRRHPLRVGVDRREVPGRSHAEAVPTTQLSVPVPLSGWPTS